MSNTKKNKKTKLLYPDYQARCNLLAKGLEFPLLITMAENVQYLSGFTGTAGSILFTSDTLYFITDRRYALQSAEEVPAFFKVLFIKKNLGSLLKTLVQTGSTLCLEEEGNTMQRFRLLQKGLSKINLKAVPSPVNKLRLIKDRYEISVVEEALRLTEEAMIYITAVTKPGMSEKQVAAMLEFYLRQKGAEAMSFTTIVASGERSALPHGVAADRIIAKNEIVLFDFGIKYLGYCSDFTRVLYTGKKLPVSIDKVWKMVREAHQIGFDHTYSGQTVAAADSAVRDFFKKNRVLTRYEHSLGHGLGLEIHESPRLSWQSDEILQPGMLVTVEPGLYFPGKFGIRLENMVLVERKQSRILTDFPMEIPCIG